MMLHFPNRMSARRRKKKREQDLTGRYLAGDLDEDQVDSSQRFSRRSKFAEQEKILRTAALRASSQPVEALPLGQVIQVYSLFCEVLHKQTVYLCVTRKTLNRISATNIVVGDRVHFRPSGTSDELGRPEGVIEQTLPRQTVLTRSDSFKAIEQHPIVANAEQMLIVVSLLQPRVKWGLVDRMIVAAQAGGLQPIICLNKIDLASDAAGVDALDESIKVLNHYSGLGLTVLRTSVLQDAGLDDLRHLLKDHTTVLAGHSGVGKSSLINALEPGLDLRTGAVSTMTEKGRHTTTSARCHPLSFGGTVIDTPGVKLFGLWGVTQGNLDDFFPDVEAGTAPAWRIKSYERIRASVD